MKKLFEGRLFEVVEEGGYEIVVHPGSVAIVPVDRAGRVVLVRQHRVPAGKTLVELPAGTLEHGEEPEATAKRELREETGLHGGSWRELARFWTTPGFVREEMHLFLAEGLDEGEAGIGRRPAGPSRRSGEGGRGFAAASRSPEEEEEEEEEEIELLRWSAEEVERRLGELEDAKTLAGLLLYLRVRADR